VFSAGSSSPAHAGERARDISSPRAECCEEQEETRRKDHRGEAGRALAIEEPICGGRNEAAATASATGFPGADRVAPGGLAEGGRPRALEAVPVHRCHHVVVGPAVREPSVRKAEPVMRELFTFT